MYIGLEVQCRYYCQILMTLELTRQDFRKKNPNIKFHENRSAGAELLHADGRTDEEI